ncbi:MAG: N-(5'-phosphoribosyl)anthranilate isomerase [Phycisphaerales bacterium]
MSHQRTRIKFCGLKTESDVDAAVDAGADAVGFVFHRKSPRYIEPEIAADLALMLPPFVDAVGLFVDLHPSEVANIAEQAFVNIIQLHGDESPADAAALATEFPIIKAVQFDADTIRRWGDNLDLAMLLIDGSSGGMGEAFDWTALPPLMDEMESPVMLAGGLTPENVGEAIRVARPFAVDVSSGVERERGVKDPALIRAFGRAVAEADASIT